MKIDEQFIKKVASNARLDLNDEEVNKFIPQFKEILKYFSELDKVNVTNINISAQPVEAKNILREDKEKPCLDQESALSNTPNKKDGYFKGPKVI